MPSITAAPFSIYINLSQLTMVDNLCAIIIIVLIWRLGLQVRITAHSSWLGDFFSVPERWNTGLSKTKKQPREVALMKLSSSVLSFRTVASQVLSTMRSLTSVFGMRTGGSFSLSPLDMVWLQANA